jgi:hypothetical protein
MMARSKDYQFDYPDKPWSEGKMRTARRVMEGSGSKEFRELEGLRKEKGQRLSQNMSEALTGESNIGTAAGTIQGPGSQTINAMESILRNQQSAQGIQGLTSAEKKKQGLHPDNLSDDQLLQQYQQGFKSGQPTVLHGSKREMELYMKALESQGGG